MEPAVFNQFRELILKTSGISLADHKVELLQARIGKRMRALGLSEPADYFAQVTGGGGETELGELLNAISTNVTHFFREPTHFQFLGRYVGGLDGGRREPLRIWCAASSTGEEPYSIAMTVLENRRHALPVEIVASDISTRVLKIAHFGVYGAEAVRGVGPALLKKYFQGGTGSAQAHYRVKPALREMVSFRQINLSTPPFPIKGELDFIFCRNVLFYFNDELKRRLAGDFREKLKPGGFLVLGLAESIWGKASGFKGVDASVYTKV